jgi:MYXO-CTERM domain-containing protein
MRQGLLAGVVAMSLAAPAQAQWTQIGPRLAMRGSNDTAFAYESATKRFVLFGGYASPSGSLNETWALAGDVWTQLKPASSPPPFSVDQFGYDTARGRLLVMTRSYGVDPKTVWEWDGAAWTSILPSMSPPPGSRSATAFDGERERWVLFGGVVDAAGDDTWEYDGASWTPVTTAHIPPARAGHVMAYDAARGVVVLMRGRDASNIFLQDWWEYDGTDWTDRTAEVTPPTGVQRLVWDPTRSCILGVGMSSSGKLGAWEYDGASWTDVTPADAPSHTSLPWLGVDVERGHALYFGPNGSTLQGWALDTNGWKRYLPAPEPAAPSSPTTSLVYDLARGEPLLFGHVDPSGTTAPMWRHDGELWRPVAVTTTVPRTMGAVYDAARSVAVAYDSATWERDEGDWKSRQPAHSPGMVFAASMAYDSSRGRSVLFGGSSAFDVYEAGTWEWDGTDWQHIVTPVSPPARYRAGMAFDAGRERIVLYGGVGMVGSNPQYLTDTWEYDGATWREIESPESPPQSADPSMVYDATARKIVLWADQVEGEEPYRTWEYDGQWTGVLSPGMPDARATGLLTYDADNERTLLYVEPGNTWIYRPTGAGAPDPSAGGAAQPAGGSGAGEPATGSGGSAAEGDESGGATSAAGGDPSDSGGESVVSQGPSSNSGCDCRAGSHPGAPWSARLLVIALSLSAVRRRRRMPGATWRS